MVKVLIDYCNTCQRIIKQVDLGDGIFRCEHCDSENIEIIDVTKLIYKEED